MDRPTLSQVRPDGVYTAPQVAHMFGLADVGTVRRWIKAGKLPTIQPDKGSIKPRHRVLGSVILKRAGLDVTPPRPTETRAQRRKRGASALAELDGLVNPRTS